MKLNSLDDLKNLLTASEQAQLTARPEKRSDVHDGKQKPVRIVLDSKGRKGKQVTVVEGLQHNPQTLDMIAKILKQHCGAGGTVKEGKIEIQGDQRARVAAKMKELNYSVTG
jgi:translation initiation factor 1